MSAVMKDTFLRSTRRLWKYKEYYMLALPGLAAYILFRYLPMGGIIIAFKDYSLVKGVFGSQWVGLDVFKTLFHNEEFRIALRNTLIISVYKIVFTFPAPIVLALLLNEVRRQFFKRTVQTLVYLPHFVSWVVISGILYLLLSPDTGIVTLLGMHKSPLISADHFRALLIVSELWKDVGWGTVIYLAAISGINQEMYEAATMDGANRFQRMVSITLPSISSTIIVLLILRMGHILEAGFNQVFILYNPMVYDVADILDTYVYRVGLTMGRFSFAAAAGVFQSAVGLALILAVNYLTKRLSSERFL
jgi:putative aldouronate transport system permease protein